MKRSYFIVAGLLATLCSSTTLAPVAQAQATLQLPGFTQTQLASGINRATAMEIAPDGRVFVSQQGGQLRVIKNGSLLPTPFVNLTVNSSGERGCWASRSIPIMPATALFTSTIRCRL
ncbi:MAG: hypothetical protein OHK0029_19390 [Armatimonadaceae bacterium]